VAAIQTNRHILAEVNRGSVHIFMLAKGDSHFRFEAPLVAGCAFLARHSTFSGWGSILPLVIDYPAPRHFGCLTRVMGYRQK
jgi:hypothetical protein